MTNQPETKKDYLKSLPTTPRDGGGSADSMDAVLSQDVAAASEADRKEALMSKMGSTARRAGAGGTKAGLVGIRPNGGKAASDFHSTFTEADKPKTETSADTWLEQSKWVKNDTIKPLAAITGSFCGGCGKRATMEDVQMCFFPVMPNRRGQRHKEMTNLEYMDLVGAIMCAPCHRYITNLKNSHSRLSIRHQGETMGINQYKALIWEFNFQENVFEYLRQQRLSVDSPCFLKDRKDEKANPE